MQPSPSHQPARRPKRPPARSLVQVVPHLGMGGMQQVARELDDGLASVGVSSRLLPLDSLTGRSRTWGAARAWHRLRHDWIDPASRPDAVMAHSMLTAALALSAASSAGVARRIVVVHGNQTLIGPRKTLLLTMLCRSGVCTDVVFCGQSAADSFGGCPGVQQRAHVVPNGVRLPSAPPPTDNPTTRALRVIMAGRLVTEKNPRRLVDAAAACHRRVEVTICGDGPEADRLRRFAAQRRAPVTFTGAVPHAELLQRYAHSDVFAFPSLVEGLPLVVLEAAASGLAVVASDLPFNHEVLGDAARYCDPDDTAAWARALDELAVDADERARLAAGAQARAPLFSLEGMLRGYADVLAN